MYTLSKFISIFSSSFFFFFFQETKYFQTPRREYERERGIQKICERIIANVSQRSSYS